MSKFGLILDLDESVRSPKTKYQLYEVEMGFERAQVLIPFDQASVFESAAQSQQPKGKHSLAKLAKQFGGTIQ